MAAFVVDTNVAVVANGKTPQADPRCVVACLDALSEVRSGLVVLDDAMRILNEYMDHLSLRGEPGAGDAFMKWVWTVQADEAHCERVTLTRRYDRDDGDFLEFPEDPELAAFDRSDRKFVAVALASISGPVVLNAVDSDWAHHHKALQRNGLRVRFLCPQHVRP